VQQPTKRRPPGSVPSIAHRSRQERTERCSDLNIGSRLRHRLLRGFWILSSSDDGNPRVMDTAARNLAYLGGTKETAFGLSIQEQIWITGEEMCRPSHTRVWSQTYA
jgi:hypothetical protein